MKNIAIVGIILAALSVGCGKKDHSSAVQSIASTANDQLIADLDAASETNQELTLKDVLTKKEHYGLSDNEVKTMREAFTEDEFNRLVLTFVDPYNKRGMVAPRWAFVPDVADDSDELKEIEVIDKEGRKELIDGTDDGKEWSYPVITLGFSEKMSGPSELEKLSSDTGQETEGALVIDTIYFKKDHEPNIKGKADVYAVISYIDKLGNPMIETVELVPVNHDKKTYTLGKIVHRWSNNKYQYINISFFEHDSKLNWWEIGTRILGAVSAAAGIFAGTHTAEMIFDTVSKIADVVKDAVNLTDGDDYMDTVNTIEKYSPGARTGAGGNVKLEMSFKEVRKK